MSEPESDTAGLRVPTDGRRALFLSALLAAQSAQANAGHEIEQWMLALKALDAEDASYE